MTAPLADPALNVPLLLKTMEHIEAHPEEHNQRHWVIRTGAYVGGTCKTACCFAGHAVLLGDPQAEFVFSQFSIATQRLRDGREVGEAARTLLGLTYGQASRLFHHSNTREELRLLVDRLAAGDPLPPLPSKAQLPPGSVRVTG